MAASIRQRPMKSGRSRMRLSTSFSNTPPSRTCRYAPSVSMKASPAALPRHSSPTPSGLSIASTTAEVTPCRGNGSLSGGRVPCLQVRCQPTTTTPCSVSTKRRTTGRGCQYRRQRSYFSSRSSGILRYSRRTSRCVRRAELGLRSIKRHDGPSCRKDSSSNSTSNLRRSE